MNLLTLNSNFVAFQGVTGEDYDLYFEVWQEFDPQGTQYMEYK